MRLRGVLCAVLALAGVGQSAVAADQTWEISGKIQVEESQTVPPKPVHRELAGVTVEVHGANVGRLYDSWGTVHTDSEGNFTLKKVKNKNKRHLKVRVRFQDKETMLSVNTPLLGGGLVSDWYQVFETSNTTDGPKLNIGTKVFQVGASGDLGKSDNVKRGTAYYIMKRVMDTLKSKGGGIQFTNGITVAYPANVISGVSYANGVFSTAYIHRNDKSDNFSADTIIHECMHLWNYQHNHGTSNWLQAVWTGKSTHEFQEKAAIAFHEGFAAWAAGALLKELWSQSVVLPPNRFSLARNGLNDFAKVERNDDGVAHGLHLLITPQIWAYKFGTSGQQVSTADTAGPGSFTAARKGSQPSGMPASPNVTIWDVFKVFVGGQHSSWPNAWGVGKKDNGLGEFLRRAADILPNFDGTHRAMMIEMLTSSLTKEPTDFM